MGVFEQSEMVMFEHNQRRVVVVHVWIREVCNIKPRSDVITSYWGLGDLIRGSAGVHSLCSKHGIECHVVTRFHPMGKYFEPETHLPEHVSQVVEERVRNGQVRWETFYAGGVSLLETFILTETQKTAESVVVFSTNATLDVYERELPEETKTYMRKLLRLNPLYCTSFRDRVHRLTSSLRKKCDTKYDVVHVRLRDETERVTKHTRATDAMHAMLKLCLCAKPGSIMLTSSSTFRRFVREHIDEAKLGIVNDTGLRPAHVGWAGDEGLLDDTAFEFWLMCTASSIKTYSAYEWTSNFATAAQHIFGVRLVDIKPWTTAHSATIADTLTRLQYIRNESYVRQVCETALQELQWHFYVRYHGLEDWLCEVSSSSSSSSSKDDAVAVFHEASVVRYAHGSMLTSSAHHTRSAHAFVRHMVRKYASNGQRVRHMFDDVFYREFYFYLSREHHVVTKEDAKKHYAKVGRSRGMLRNGDELVKIVCGVHGKSIAIAV